MMETKSIPTGLQSLGNRPNTDRRSSHQNRHENLCEKILKDDKALEQWNQRVTQIRAKER